MGIQERKERERERRRQQIMVAAKRVFTDKGFGKATMEDIANEFDLDRIAEVTGIARQGAQITVTTTRGDIAAGKLGTITLAHCYTYRPRNHMGPKGEYPVPETVDYDLWAGPAPRSR